MGIVYEALDRERHTRVALKTLRSLEATALLRLKNEFRALQDLHHPNLVSLGELIEQRGQWFFTMELVDGVDLLTWVRPLGRSSIRPVIGPDDPTQPVPSPALARVVRTAPQEGLRFDEERLRTSLRQLAVGLSALHDFGKVHRDIKPSNVLVDRDGRVVLLDFGLVFERNRKLHVTDSQMVIGTAPYMAPEQASSKGVGPEADWYSMGVVLYQALTGSLPFEGAALEILLAKQRFEPAPPSAVAAGVPADLDVLCSDLLRTDPGLRPSGQEVLRRLGAAAGTAAAAAVPAAVQAQPFVGRARELSVLRTAFADARKGAAVTVCARGESGVGKSALVRQFTDQLALEHPGSVVLAGRCTERESVPYKAVDGVIDALSRYMMQLPAAEGLLPRMAPLLAQAFPVLGRVAAIAQAPRPQPEVRDPHELRRRAFAALRELLLRLADRHPLVLVIDDLQWADADSLALLADVLRPPEAPAVLLVATLCPLPEAAAVAPGGLDVPAWIEGDVRMLEVGRLPPDEARTLAELLLCRAGAGGAFNARAIAEESGGHPLFIDELIRYVMAHGTHGQTGVHLEDALWARIGALDRPALRILQLVAAAGAPLAQDIVAQAAGLELADFARLTTVLRLANLVRISGIRGADAIEPYHDRVRDTVLHHLDQAALRASQERLALALQASAKADPEALAIHWHGAGDAPKAARFAAEAADEAAAALAFDRAARLYRVALEFYAADAAEAPTLRARLGESLANAGRGAEAAQAYLLAAQGANPADALEFQRRAAEQLLVSGHIDEGLAAIRTVLAAVGMKLPATPGRALASLIVGRAKLRLRGLRFRERDASQISLQELRRIDLCWSVAGGLALVDTLRSTDFQTRHMLLALAAGEPSRIARALAVEIPFAALNGGRSRHRVQRFVAAASALVERLGQPPALGRLLGSQGGAAFLQGRFREGLELSDRGGQIMREQSTGMVWEADTAQIFALYCLAYLGELAELSRRVPQRLRDALERGDLYLATTLRLGYNNLVWLARDDPDGAADEIEGAMRRWSPRGTQLQHYLELVARVHIDLYRGDGPAARARIEERWRPLRRAMFLHQQVIRINMRFLRGRAALAVAKGEGAEAERRVHEALQDARGLEREHMAWADPLAALLRAGAAAVRGELPRALALLERAERGFAAVDMGLHGAAASRRRGMLLGGDQGRALVEMADGWMASQAIKNPAAMTTMLAPGFSD